MQACAAELSGSINTPVREHADNCCLQLVHYESKGQAVNHAGHSMGGALAQLAAYDLAAALAAAGLDASPGTASW